MWMRSFFGNSNKKPLILNQIKKQKTLKSKGTNLLPADVSITFLELGGTEILIWGRVPRICCRIMIITSWRGAIYSIRIWHKKVSWVCCIRSGFEWWKRILHSWSSNSRGRWVYTAGLRLLRKCTIAQKLVNRRRWDVKWWKIVTVRNVVRRIRGYMNPAWSEDRDRLLSNGYWALHQPSRLCHEWCWASSG